MLNTATITAAVVGILNDLVPAGTPVIQNRQNPAAPRPTSDTYVDIVITNIDQVAREYFKEVDENDFSPMVVDYSLMMQFRSLGSDAQNVMSSITYGMNRPDIVDRFANEAGLAYASETTATYIPALLESQFEERSQLEVKFFLSLTEEIDLGTIEVLENAEGTYLDNDGNIQYTSSTGIIEP